MILKEQKPLVSICSITYNHAPYIRQCLDSMLMQQTDFDYEIIINDDCSTDGTTEIIKEYESKYPHIIKPIYHDENQYSKGVRGMFAKFVFPQAQGKYIAICEGDDYWTDPLKLQKQVDFLESHPDYSMCFHNAMKHYEDIVKADEPFALFETGEFSRYQIFEKWIAPTASFCFRREVFESELYRKCQTSDKILTRDLTIILSASYMGRIWGMADIMSIYRIMDSGMLLNTLAKNPDLMFYNFVEIERIFPQDMSSYCRNLLGSYARNAVSMMRHGNVKKGFRLWLLVFKRMPLRCIKETIYYFWGGIWEKLRMSNKNE